MLIPINTKTPTKEIKLLKLSRENTIYTDNPIMMSPIIILIDDLKFFSIIYLKIFV